MTLGQNDAESEESQDPSQNLAAQKVKLETSTQNGVVLQDVKIFFSCIKDMLEYLQKPLTNESNNRDKTYVHKQL